MIKKKGMILKMQKTKEWTLAVTCLLTGVWSGLKLGCVMCTWCADTQMSPSEARSDLLLLLFFFILLSLPHCSLDFFAKHLGCLVSFLFVSVRCCAFDLCCAHYHEGCLCCLKTKVTQEAPTWGHIYTMIFSCLDCSIQNVLVTSWRTSCWILC